MQVNQNAMNAYNDFMASSARNVANVNTEGYEASRTVFESFGEGDVSAVSASTSKPTQLARDFTDQISIENGFDAQVKSISTKDEMLGTLLDMKG